ncbi:hypothetical protein ABW19_dt0209220 [Dactylella cylindrospora]|nr:hypothetical protein ABW19_dt0209220 [Dactylella cylindrospora]
MDSITIGYFTITFKDILSWPPPNTENPPVKGEYLIPIVSILLALSTIAIICRIYSRALIVNTFGIDDVLIVPAYLGAVSLIVAEIISLQGGWGRHIWDNDLKDARLLALCGYVAQVSVGFSGMFSKLSILFSYFRFAPKKLRYWVWATIVFVTLWGVGLMVPIILSCVPIELYWNTIFRTPDMKCLSPLAIRTIQYVQAGLNIFSDLLVLILPIPTIWHLQMPVRQKWSCAVIFTLWITATIAAVLRLWSTAKTIESVDTTWYGYDLYVYIALEAHLAIVCACAPGIKPVIVRIWPTFDEMRSSIRRKYSAGVATNSTPAPPEPEADFEFNFGFESRRSSRRLSAFPWEVNTPNTRNPTGSESVSQLCRPYEPSVIGPLSPLRASRLFSDFIQFPMTPSCVELKERDFAIRNTITGGSDSSSRRSSVELPPPVHHKHPRNRSPDSFRSKVSMSITKTTDIDVESLRERDDWA